jgi:hypothetical protein
MNKKAESTIIRLGELVAVIILLIAMFSFLSDFMGQAEAGELPAIKQFEKLTRELKRVSEGTQDTITLGLPIEDGWIMYGFDTPTIKNICGMDEDISKPDVCGLKPCVCLCSEDNFKCEGGVPCVVLPEVDFIVVEDFAGVKESIRGATIEYNKGGPHYKSPIRGKKLNVVSQMVLYGDCGSLSSQWDEQNLELEKVIDQDTGLVTIRVTILDE